MTSRTIAFHTILLVKPIAKGRARSTRSGMHYTPAATVHAEAEIRWLLRQANAPCLEGPIWIEVIAQIRRPSSVKQSKRPLPTVRPDASNLLKLIEDAANGILFADDAAICSATIEKRYGPVDQIELRAGVMEVGA